MLSPTILYSSTVSVVLTSWYIPTLNFSLDSGHGGQAKDTDGDEGDGFDEGLLINIQIINLLITV